MFVKNSTGQFGWVYLLKASYPLWKDQLGTWGGSFPDLNLSLGTFQHRLTPVRKLGLPYYFVAFHSKATIIVCGFLGQTFSCVELGALFWKKKKHKKKRKKNPKTKTKKALSFSEGVKDIHLNKGSQKQDKHSVNDTENNRLSLRL